MKQAVSRRHSIKAEESGAGDGIENSLRLCTGQSNLEVVRAVNSA